MSADPTTQELSEIAAAIADRRISSEDVVRACLERIAAWQPSRNCFLRIDGERALTVARQRDAEVAAVSKVLRSDWLTQITNEHWCPEVPHEEFRHVEPAVHHYMIQSEDQFVQKVTRLPSWLHRPKGFFARRKWDRTPDIERELPKRMGPSKREWWGVYQRGGEEGVREYYRTVYTLVGERREAAIADGSLVADPGFADYARERYEVTR